MKHELEAKILGLLDDRNLRGVVLLNTLKEHPTLASCYPRPLGGKENHTLEEHTLKALSCFEDNFEGKAKTIFEPQHFKLLFALHDLGKPQSMLEEQFDKQHEYTLEIIEEVKDDIHFPEELLSKIIAVIDADPIGRYLNKKHNLPLKESLREINKMASDLAVPVSTLWPTLMIYYQCDAAGYEALRRKVFITDDAGRAIYFQGIHGFKLKDPDEAERFAILQEQVSKLG